MQKDKALTIIIMVTAVGISAFLWSIGVYFFFLPIIFLPFLRKIRIGRISENTTCPVCGLTSSGNYCPRCGNRLR